MNENFDLTENILKSKFQTGITFDVVLIMNQNFNIVFKCIIILFRSVNHLKIVKSKIQTFWNLILDLSIFLSLWSRGLD